MHVGTIQKDPFFLLTNAHLGMFRKGALYNSFSIFLNWFKGHWFSNNCTAWVMKWSYSATIWKIIKLSFWRFGGDWLISIVVKWWVVKGVIFKGNHTISTIWIYYDLCQMRQYFSQLFRLGQTVLLWPTWRQLWQIVIFCSITGRSKVGLKKIIKNDFINRDILLSVLAFRSLGTKSNQPIRAHYFPYMPYQIYLWSFVRKTVFKVGYVFLMIVVSHAEFGRNDIRGAYSTLINWIPSMNIYISGVPCTLSLSILILNVKRAP